MLTKADRLSRGKLNDVALATRDAVRQFDHAQPELLAVSASTRDGIPQLQLHICMMAGIQPPSSYLAKYPSPPETPLPFLALTEPSIETLPPP